MAEPRSLTPTQARRLRLASQRLLGSELSPAEVVRRFVAMQGQDLAAVLRAIAIRSAPGTTLADVRAAFDAGLLVRSWAMRGTLFVASPDDLAVLHAATGERLRRQEWRMCARRGIDEATAERAAEVLVAELAAGPTRRRSMLEAWEAAGIGTAGGNGYHLLALCAYDGLVRFGPFEGDEQLLVGGAPPEIADPDAAVDAALERFAIARGPVRADDAAWWLGVAKRPVRAALERASALERVRVGRDELLVEAGAEPVGRAGVTLVPAFDEWLLGYEGRSRDVSEAVLRAAVPGGNGVFRPLVLVDGVAVGTWRIPLVRGRAGEPILELVEPVADRTRAAIERALERWPHR
ncbi:winged helix DNA-binding domain-containing protein [Agrococcus lahaulensis]|uniref:winged helix DNA-binding domain-containing protein n=1 Tax=Agrococcus lahaulensis TaxID=341722 RepID=UPI00047A8F91|nr:winged helix DNA-binding domain-containing protein [Agrococcus lahaulensis]